MTSRSEYKKLKSGICHYCDYTQLCRGKSNKCAKRERTRQMENRHIMKKHNSCKEHEPQVVQDKKTGDTVKYLPSKC